VLGNKGEFDRRTEGELGENWAKASQTTTHLEAAQREIAGGWWMWALRDAVVRTIPDFGVRLAPVEWAGDSKLT
jgi:hypothetical protein